MSRVIKPRKRLGHFGQNLVYFLLKTSNFTSSQRGLHLAIRDKQGYEEERQDGNYWCAFAVFGCPDRRVDSGSG